MTPTEACMLKLSYKYVPPLQQRMLAALEESPKTLRELCFFVDAHYQSVYKALTLFRTLQIIHIAGWAITEHGPFLPRYGIGYAKAAPRPKKLTPIERSQRYRRKIKILSGVTFTQLLKGI